MASTLDLRTQGGDGPARWLASFAQQLAGISAASASQSERLALAVASREARPSDSSRHPRRSAAG